MKKIAMGLLLIFLATPAQAKRLYSEATYQRAWCEKRGGIMEYKLNDKTRVDCLLPDMAVEFDFANKWAECIGQAIYYGRMTNRQAVCVLIMENGRKRFKIFETSTARGLQKRRKYSDVHYETRAPVHSGKQQN